GARVDRRRLADGFLEVERRAAPGEEVVDLLGHLLAERALDDGGIEDAAAGDDLAEGRRGPPLLGEKLIELVAGDLSPADEDLSQRVRAARAAHEADAFILEGDDLLLTFDVDREKALAARHGQGLEEVGDPQDFDVAFDLSHAVSARVGPS